METTELDLLREKLNKIKERNRISQLKYHERNKDNEEYKKKKSENLKKYYETHKDEVKKKVKEKKIKNTTN